MLFDVNKLSNEKKEKIAKGALKYCAIKESFGINIALYDNEIFKKWFTDFYKLDGGAFCTPTMMDVFYRVFQSLKNLNDYWKSQKNLESLFLHITTILSDIVGDVEVSFPSKILHTLYNDSPIIDKNVKDGLRLNNQETAVDVYRELCNKYNNESTITIKGGALYKPMGGCGLCTLADKSNENWYANFVIVCKTTINAALQNNDCEVIEILKDICKAVEFKRATNKIDLLQKELKIEETFANANNENLLDQINDQWGIDITALIENISEVKKIDFGLWALFAKEKKKGKEKLMAETSNQFIK